MTVLRGAGSKPNSDAPEDDDARQSCSDERWRNCSGYYYCGREVRLKTPLKRLLLVCVGVLSSIITGHQQMCWCAVIHHHRPPTTSGLIFEESDWIED